MSLVKVNNYDQGIQDISNMALNVDYLRKGVDLTYIEESGGNYFVKVGSIIEFDGDTYIVQDSDEQISVPTSIYVGQTNTVFFDGSTFYFDFNTPTYDGLKNGFYYSGDRATRWAVTGLATSTFVISLVERNKVFFDEDIVGDLNVTGDLVIDGTLFLTGTEILYTGTVTALTTYTTIEEGISGFLTDFVSCQYSFTGGTPSGAVIEIFTKRQTGLGSYSLMGYTTTSTATGTFILAFGDVNATNYLDLFARVTIDGTALPCDIEVSAVRV